MKLSYIFFFFSKEECPTINEPAPVCENIHADSKCIKNKNKGKCGKKWMKKKCKKECGYC